MCKTRMRYITQNFCFVMMEHGVKRVNLCCRILAVKKLKEGGGPFFSVS